MVRMGVRSLVMHYAYESPHKDKSAKEHVCVCACVCVAFTD